MAVVAVVVGFVVVAFADTAAILSCTLIMRVISTVGKLYTNCGSQGVPASVGVCVGVGVAVSMGVPTCSAMGAKQLTN